MKSPSHIFTTIARVLLGLLFLVFGLDWFLHFMPQPKDMTIPAPAMAFYGALAGSGYMNLVKGIEVVGGALLLVNCFLPLGLVLLAPIIVNVAAFNILLAPSGMGYGMSAVIIALELWLAWAYRSALRPMLALHTPPA
jgi:uncharacterized membrane protein YphA (DoxX/SURF4 family)